MKAEVTVSPDSKVAGLQMYGGMSPNLPYPAGKPDKLKVVEFPIQVQGNVQGQLSSLYYSYSKDLRKQGAPHSNSTDGVYPTSKCGTILVTL